MKGIEGGFSLGIVKFRKVPLPVCCTWPRRRSTIGAPLSPAPTLAFAYSAPATTSHPAAAFYEGLPRFFGSKGLGFL